MSSPTQWLRGAVFATALRLRINGKPKPAPRPRMSRNGHAYTHKDYADWTKNALDQLGTHDPIQGPVAVALDVIGERPGKTVLNAPRGDCDNFAKSVLDALTKARAWVDDTQVTSLLVRKRWGGPTETPGVDIWIAPIPA